MPPSNRAKRNCHKEWNPETETWNYAVTQKSASHTDTTDVIEELKQTVTPSGKEKKKRQPSSSTSSSSSSSKSQQEPTKKPPKRTKKDPNTPKQAEIETTKKAKAEKLVGSLSVLSLRGESVKTILMSDGIKERIPAYITEEVDTARTMIYKYITYWKEVLSGKKVPLDKACAPECVDAFLVEAQGCIMRAEQMAGHAQDFLAKKEADENKAKNPKTKKKEKKEKKCKKTKKNKGKVKKEPKDTSETD